MIQLFLFRLGHYQIGWYVFILVMHQYNFNNTIHFHIFITLSDQGSSSLIFTWSSWYSWIHLRMTRFSNSLAVNTDGGSIGLAARRSRWCAASSITIASKLSDKFCRTPKGCHGSSTPLLHRSEKAYMKYTLLLNVFH